ncbi:MAG: hypothetical protein K2H64_09645 [Desulfovibrio sp.]|nr:hypothetical protein [Desulfovibrio sp.]
MCKLKIIFLGLFAVASLCLAVVAEAIDFKVKDWWLVSMQYGQNGNFCDHGHQGYDYLEDEFEARSRVRIQLDAVASENLSGQVYFEIGKFIWGKGVGEQSGAPLGADARNVIKLKRAFIEWTIPDTRPRVKMGIQAFRTPYLALDGPIVMTADGAGVIASYTVNDNIALTGFWMRPYNDNYVSAPDKNESGFMDNLDVGGCSSRCDSTAGLSPPGQCTAQLAPIPSRTTRGSLEPRFPAGRKLLFQRHVSLAWR